MVKTEQTVQNLASTYLDWFEKSSRDDGSKFYKLIDGYPLGLLYLVRNAHGEMLPDDWRYEFIYESLALISESVDPEDPGFEADIYYHELLQWLSSRTDRCDYVDEAVEEFGFPNPFNTMTLIGMGQLRELKEVYFSVLSNLQEFVGEKDA